MKTYKQFLEESVYFSKMGNTITNSTKVRGNWVDCEFKHLGDNHWDHSFTVNGRMKHGESKVVPGSEHHVALHVGNVIGHFIKQHNPDSVEYLALNRDHHTDGFQKGGKIIAKKTGYHYKKEGMMNYIKKPSLIRKIGRSLGVMG